MNVLLVNAFSPLATGARPSRGSIWAGGGGCNRLYQYTYYTTVEASTPFLAIYGAGAALFRVMGSSRISMWVSLVMNVINAAGNAILIFGFYRGVEGVAIPTLLSRVFTAAAMLFLLRRPNLPM